MKAVLHQLHSPDAGDLATYRPDGPAFGLLVQAMIGPDPGKGEESFDFVVCSPAWLADRVKEAGFVLPRHHLIIDSYSFEGVRAAIENICDEAKGEDWVTLATYIARFGKWEFEGYRPHESA